VAIIAAEAVRALRLRAVHDVSEYAGLVQLGCPLPVRTRPHVHEVSDCAGFVQSGAM
jgi:hypothetical protein